MDEFTNLGFDITADDKASAKLQTIINQLQQIQSLTGSTFNIGGANSVGTNSTQITQSLQRQAKQATQTAQAVGVLSNKQLSYTNALNSSANAELRYENAQRDVLSAIDRLNNAQISYNQALERRKDLENQLSNYTTLKQRTSLIQKYNTALQQEEKAGNTLAIAQNNLDNAYAKEESALNSLNSSRNSAQKSLNNLTQTQDKNAQSLSKLAIRWTTLIMLTRQATNAIINSIRESSSFVENLNLFAVTFGDTYEETLDWALEFADNLGYASNEIVRFTGLFKQLATSIGVTGEIGTQMSETLTQLGYDLASFYNISVESAFEKLQAGIFSGQTKPLRSLGLDVTQQTLDNLLKTDEAFSNIGVTSSKALLQSEKAMLRLIVVLKNAQNAFGDVQKTINTTDNQIRVFQSSVSNLKLAIGDTFAQPFNSALIAVNGFIMGITKIIRAFIPLNKESQTASVSMQQFADDTEEALDTLSGKNLDIDEFRALQTTDDSQVSITETITQELQKQIEKYKEYLNSLTDIENKATDIAEKIKSWFIVTDEDGNFKEWTAQAKGLGLVIAGITTYKFASSISGQIKAISTATEQLTKSQTVLRLIFSKTGLILGSVFAILAYGYATNEDFRESVNRLVSAVLSLLGTAITPLAKILDSALLPAFTSLLNITIDLITPFINLLSWVLELGDGWAVLGTAIGVVSVMITGKLIWAIANLVVNLKSVKIQLTDFANGINTLQNRLILAAVGAGLLVGSIADLATNWGNMSGMERASKILTAVAGAAFLAASAVAALHTSWSLGAAAAAIGVGVVAVIASIATAAANAKKTASEIQGFANGGITDANFIMTHENGKSEWVGKQGNKRAVVNDSQMSTIMSKSVAQGVYEAMSAQNAYGGYTNQPIIIKLDSEVVYNEVVKTARKQGKEFKKI